MNNLFSRNAEGERAHNLPKGSMAYAHKLPMFGRGTCPDRRREAEKPPLESAQRTAHGHDEIARRAV